MTREQWTFKASQWREFQREFERHLDRIRKTLGTRNPRHKPIEKMSFDEYTRHLKRKHSCKLECYFWVKIPHRKKGYVKCYLFIFHRELPQGKAIPKKDFKTALYYHRKTEYLFSKKYRDMLRRINANRKQRVGDFNFFLRNSRVLLRIKHLMKRAIREHPAWKLPKRRKVYGHSDIPLWVKACKIGKWAEEIVYPAIRQGYNLEMLEITPYSKVKDRIEMKKPRHHIFGKEYCVYTFNFTRFNSTEEGNLTKETLSVSTLNPYILLPFPRECCDIPHILGIYNLARGKKVKGWKIKDIREQLRTDIQKYILYDNPWEETTDIGASLKRKIRFILTVTPQILRYLHIRHKKGEPYEFPPAGVIWMFAGYEVPIPKVIFYPDGSFSGDNEYLRELGLIP